jgi:hypothetical protein
LSGILSKRAKLIALANSWPGPSGATPGVHIRKPRPIEELLRWAYLEELPKIPRIAAGPAGYGVAWNAISRWADELSLAAANENRYGVLPDLSIDSFPHADAFRVHDAVAALDDWELGLPDDWSPLADLGPLDGHAVIVAAKALDVMTVVDADGKRKLRRSPRRLIFRHAILGGCPDVEVWAPEIKTVTEYGKAKWFLRSVVTTDGAFGPLYAEVEIDGYDHKRRRPRPGAYQKTWLDPDPLDDVISRGEYEIWRSALDVLTSELSGALADFDVVPCSRPMRPWEEPPAAAGRVLQDESEPANENLKSRRGRKGRR